MASSSSNPFGAGCSEGGDWYACGNGAQFVGCCTVDACSDRGCPTRNVRLATFDASEFGNFPDQACSEGDWYVCSANDVPFMGCCTSNACSGNGCPATDLRAGSLSSNVTAANAFNPSPALSSSTSSIASSTSSATSSATRSPTASATPLPRTSAAPKVAGGVAGGLAGLFLIMAIIIWRWRSYMRSSRQEVQDTQERRLMAALTGPEPSPNYTRSTFSWVPTGKASPRSRSFEDPRSFDPEATEIPDTGALMYNSAMSSPPSSIGQLSRDVSPQTQALQWLNPAVSHSAAPVQPYRPYPRPAVPDPSLLSARYQGHGYAQVPVAEDIYHAPITELAGADENSRYQR